MHYSEEVKRQQDEIRALNKEISKLKQRTAIVPALYILKDPLEIVHSGKRRCLEPFYSHCNGYKLSLHVYKNLQQGVIIFQTYLMQGEFDSLLKWPFKSVIKIQLQNAHGADDIKLKIKTKSTERVVVQDGMEKCGDVSDSVTNITRCVVDNCLHINIVSVELKQK